MRSITTYHKHFPATIKASSIRVAPDVFDAVGIPAHESFFQVKESPFYRFSVAL
jgi:hypothetical protein